MTDRGIPEEVRRFVSEHIHAAEELDLLLLLHRTPERAWDATAASQAVYSVPASTADRLRALAHKGLLSVEESGGEPLYRYAPAGEGLARQVAALAEVYRTRRVEIVNLVFSARADPLRSFADAFKLKKKEP